MMFKMVVLVIVFGLVSSVVFAAYLSWIGMLLLGVLGLAVSYKLSFVVTLLVLLLLVGVVQYVKNSVNTGVKFE